MTLIPGNPFTLPTARLRLRDFQPADFAPFFATTADPAYRQFYPPAEMTEAHWRQVFARILEGGAASPRRVYQLAICLSDGTLIGTCGVRVEDPIHQQASFGCAVDRRFWGRGYAREASTAVIDHSFSRLHIHRLYAETIRENEKACALAERLGMQLEGVLRQTRYFRGRWWDTAVYALLKEAWHSSSAK